MSTPDRPRRSAFPVWLMIALGLVFTMMVSGCVSGVMVTLLVMSRRAEQKAKAAEAMMTPVETVRLGPPDEERADRLSLLRLEDRDPPVAGLDDFTEVRPLLPPRPSGDALRSVVGAASVRPTE